MTFDPTKPVEARDGRKAEIIKTDIQGPHQIAAVITGRDGEETVETYNSKGVFHKDPSSWDLINIPEEHEVLVYLCKDISGVSFVSEASRGGTASKRITFTEGEFEE